MIIYCCGCKKDIEASLTSGSEVYKGRDDLANLPIWICLDCKNYVGCHWKTKNPTKPLGCIPTAEIKKGRQHIHRILDPLWKDHSEPFRARAWIYRWLAQKIGKTDYHTAEIRTIEEAREIYRLVATIKVADDCRLIDN